MNSNPLYLAVPEPVSELKIANSTSSTLSIIWKKGYSGGNTLDQSFLIAYREKTVIEFTSEDRSRAEEYVIAALKSGTSYEIRVVAENNVGRSVGKFITAETLDVSKPLPQPRNNNAVVVAMGAAIAILLFMIVILIIVVYRLRKRYSDGRTNSIPKPEREENFGFEKEGCINDELSVETSFQNQPNENSYGNTLGARNFILTRSSIKIEQEIGHGEFGKVLKATAKGIRAGNKATTLAVKTLKDNANDEAKQLLLKEFKIMKVLMVALRDNMNPNIVFLYGGCMEKDPLYMILEYMAKGDLKSLLRESRVSKDGTDKTYDNLAVGSRSLTPVQLIRFALDVANGMAFLAAQKCIHRDLAARNVLLNEKYECKVSDFGLAQDVMDIEVYQRTNQCKLPIRWMAIESLDDKVHTLESDVWAYGVLLWEIITLGARPYPRMKAGEIRQMLRTGYRMPKPSHCNEQLYDIMLACWDKEPSKRPSYQQIMRLLEEVIEGQMGYLTLADIESKLYEDTTMAAVDEKV